MNKRDEFELSFAKVLRALWKRLPIILLVFAVTAVAGAYLFRTPVVTKYVAKAAFLVPRDYYYSDRTIEYEDPESNSYTDKTEKLTLFSYTNCEAYCFTATAPNTCDIIASRAGLPYTGEELAGMVTAAPQKTNVLTFYVQTTNKDKDEALRIIHAFSEILPEIIHEISSEPPLHVLNSGTVSAQTSGGLDVKKTLTVAAVAAAITAFFFILLTVFQEYTGRISVFSSDLKRLYPETKTLSAFSSADDGEAAKRLRTNVCLALPEQNGCRMIGLTAAHPEPFKDELALNLAKSFAETGDRILLVDADLRSGRLQSLAKAEAGDGLSELIRKTGSAGSAGRVLKEGDLSFSFLPAGSGAADASELLDPRKLLPVLSELKADYDLVLLDLESIGSSVDAASVGKDLDGVLVVLRDEKYTRNQLDECMAQLDYAKAKVLGFVEVKNKTLWGKLRR